MVPRENSRLPNLNTYHPKAHVVINKSKWRSRYLFTTPPESHPFTTSITRSDWGEASVFLDKLITFSDPFDIMGL